MVKIDKKDSLQSLYSKRIKDFSLELNRLQGVISRITLLRFFVFVMGIAAIWYFYHNNQNYIIYSGLLFIIIFLFLVKIHSKLLDKKKLQENLIQINKEELHYHQGKISDFDGGHEFLQKQDMHSADLDVFGKKSLFQKINRTATISGKYRLAHWFRFPNQEKEIILQKQKVIQELAGEIDFRQTFRAVALTEEEKRGDYVKMIRWMIEDNYFSSRKIFKILSYVVPILNISLTGFFAFNIIPYQFPTLSALFTLVFLGFFQKTILRQHKVLSRRSKLLLKYVDLLKAIEDRNFNSNLLKNLQQEMSEGKRKAHEHIGDLVKMLQALDQRLNMLMGVILNTFLFWDIHHLIRIEKWKRTNAEEMIIWFNNIGIMDAYCSLANLAFNEPHWIYPLISNDKLIAGKEMRHPLMDTSQCVPNDIEIIAKPHFKIITGANMAGKSTFLRTVGANLLLSMMGSVVHASEFEFVPVKIVTSLKTTDSLMKNESYFYAELMRLQVIIKMLEKKENVIVFLDEILKGTNSKDKELGSIALLEQLINLNAYGIIATHDLNLAKVSTRFAKNTENLRFEAEIKDDKLSFDYKIKSGIAQNLNATFLMKRMGITI